MKVAEKITLKQSLFIKLSQDLAKLEGKETFASFAFSHNMLANPSMVPSLRVKGEEIQNTFSILGSLSSPPAKHSLILRLNSCPCDNLK